MAFYRIVPTFMLLLATTPPDSAGLDYRSLPAHEKKDMERQVREAFRSMFIGDINVAGGIEDEDGNGLTNVTIHCYLQTGDGSKMRFATNVAVRFRFAYTNVTDLTLRVHNEGYYEETVWFSINSDVPMGPSGRRVVSNLNLSIRLMESGEPALLLSGQGLCSYSTVKDSFAVQVTSSGLDRYRLSSSNTVRANSFYLTAQTNQHGIVATEASGSRRREPADLFLNIHGDGSGVRRHHPAPSSATRTEIVRSMREVPTDGFTNRIHLVDGEREAYFFFRFDEWSGKGWLRRNTGVYSSGTGIRALVSTRTQTNGSSNVRSAR